MDKKLLDMVYEFNKKYKVNYDFFWMILFDYFDNIRFNRLIKINKKHMAE